MTSKTLCKTPLHLARYLLGLWYCRIDSLNQTLLNVLKMVMRANKLRKNYRLISASHIPPDHLQASARITLAYLQENLSMISTKIGAWGKSQTMDLQCLYNQWQSGFVLKPISTMFSQFLQEILRPP